MNQYESILVSQNQCAKSCSQKKKIHYHYSFKISAQKQCTKNQCARIITHCSHFPKCVQPPQNAHINSLMWQGSSPHFIEKCKMTLSAHFLANDLGCCMPTRNSSTLVIALSSIQEINDQMMLLEQGGSSVLTRIWPE